MICSQNLHGIKDMELCPYIDQVRHGIIDMVLWTRYFDDTILYYTI